MTLIYGSGFEMMTATADIGNEGWFLAGGGGGATVTCQTTNGRQGGVCLTAQRGNGGGNTPVYIGKVVPTQTGQSYVGVAHNATTANSANSVISILDSGSIQIDLRLNAVGTGSLQLTRNGTQLAVTANGLVSYGTYHYYEMGFVIASGTGGSVTVRLDGVTVLSVSGVNTQATGNASWNQLYLGGGNSQSVLVDERFDDVYVCDANGSQNNNFLGDIGFVRILPTGDGSNSGFTQVGGTGGHNYTSVNEIPNTGDTSYVVSGIVGTVDTYDYPSLPGGTASVLAVIAKYVMRKDDTGGRHITARYRASGGTEADFTATDTSLSSNYVQTQQIQEVNPVTTAAWLPADIGSGEFGFRVSS